MSKTKKKIIYLSVFLVLALFLISACSQTKGARIINQNNDLNNEGSSAARLNLAEEVPIGDNIFGLGLFEKKIKLYGEQYGTGFLEFNNNINTQSSLAGFYTDDDYHDKVVLTAISNSIRLNYYINGVDLNSASSSNPLEINFFGKNLDIVRIYDKSFVLNDGNTYTDGDPYIGENPEDPKWVWSIENLNSAAGGDVSDAKMGVKLDQNYRDGSDNSAIEVGQCLDLVNYYGKICLNKLTLLDSDYMDLQFELQENIDLTSDSGIVGYSNANVIHVNANSENILLLGSILKNLNGDRTTNELWIINNLVFFKDLQKSNKKTFAGTVNNNQFGIINIKSKDVYLNIFKFTDNSYSLGLNTANDNLDTIWSVSSYGVLSLGNTKSYEEADELTYQEGSNFNYNLGVKDENHRTKYGIIIKDPKSNGASDRVELSIPYSQVKAVISLNIQSKVAECPANCQCDDQGNVLSCSKEEIVTYQGVLNMLNKCSVIDGSDSGISSPESYNCNNVCRSKNLNCALGIGTFKVFDSTIGDQKVVIRSCGDSTSPYNTYLSCFCCSSQ